MAISQQGYRATLALKVREEVLETRWAFKAQSAPSSTLGTKALADALGALSVNVLFTGMFGSDVKLLRWRVRPIGFGDGWGWDLPLFSTGTGATVSMMELNHVRLNLISAPENGERKVNRNQIPGCPSGDIIDGRVGNDLFTTIQNFLNYCTDGRLNSGGFTFLMGVESPTPLPVQVPEFYDLAQFSVPAYVGTRIDRTLNRNNNPRKKQEQPAPPPA